MLSRLVARYRAEGDAAFEPRSRRPNRSPTATGPETVELVLRLNQLQAQLEVFTDYDNQRRPHHAVRRRTPLAAYLARPKATPVTVEVDQAEPDTRIRRDRIDDTGAVTLRHHGRLHHIGIGRTHARTHVLLLIVDRDIRVINQHTGELLR